MSKKLTGRWTDNQGFTHIIIYQRGNLPHEGPYPYTKLIYNPQGKFCSHAHYDKKDIQIIVSGMKPVEESQ